MRVCLVNNIECTYLRFQRDEEGVVTIFTRDLISDWLLVLVATERRYDERPI